MKSAKLSILFFALLSIALSNAQNKLSIKQIDSLIKLNSFHVHSNPEKAIKLATKIYQESQKNDYDIGVAVSLQKISLYHNEIKRDYKKALKYNDEGLAISKKINNDSLVLFFTYQNGNLHSTLGYTEKAIKIMKECLKKTNCIKDFKKKKLFIGDIYSNLFYLHYSSTNPIYPPSTLLKYAINAMNEYQYALDICINPGYSNVGIAYVELKEYYSAKYYLKKAIVFLKAKKISCEIEYSDIADAYYRTGDYDIAIKYLDSSNAIYLKNPSINYTSLSYNYSCYKNIYTKIKDEKNTLKYTNLELIYKDSANIQKKQQLKESANYWVSEKENENKNLKLKNQIIIIGSVLSFIIVVALILFYYKKRNYKLKRQAFLKENDLQQKSSEIQELKQKVSTSYEELIEMAKRDNPLFVSFFKELYPNFYKKLKEIQPDLTVLEQKICFYLKLKFTTKEIAYYTFVSIKAIQNRKNRLRKRLFIEEGEDIYDWFDKID